MGRLAYNRNMVKFLKGLWVSCSAHLRMHKTTYLSLSLFVLGVLLYSFGFQNQMFWDDDDFILKNVYVHDLSLWRHYFTENVIAGSGLVSNYWRPILLTVFGFEWKLFGDSPVGWHFVNAVTHSLNSIFIFLLLKKVSKKLFISFIAASIFLIHPVQTEAVVYVNSFGDSLSVFFMLLGLLTVSQWSSLQSTVAKMTIVMCSSVLYMLALLSKETAIIMPALVVIVVGYDFRNLGFWEMIRRIVSRTWYLWVIALLYLFARATVANFKNSFNLYDQPTLFSEHLYIRLFTFCKSLLVYIGLLLWPSQLHMERESLPVLSFFEPHVLVGGALLLVFGYMAVRYWRQKPLLAFAILWFFIAFAPTSNIVVPINGLLYEHWLYVPIIGFGIFFGLLSEASYFRFPNYRPTIVLVLLVIFIGLCVRTVVRIKDWADPIRFYTQTLQFAPQSYRIVNNLGMSYANVGDQVHALDYYNRAIKLDAHNPVGFHNRANTFASLGNFDAAIQDYETAIRVDPQFVFSYEQLARLYSYLGRAKESDQVILRLCKVSRCN